MTIICKDIGNVFECGCYCHTLCNLQCFYHFYWEDSETWGEKEMGSGNDTNQVWTRVARKSVIQALKIWILDVIPTPYGCNKSPFSCIQHKYVMIL